MTKTPLTRLDLQALAGSRLAEARTLCQNGHNDGAVYLAGYALEFAFKARVCKILDAHYPTDFRDFRTHKYQVLLKLAGLESQLDRRRATDVKFSNYWSILLGPDTTQGWSEEWRYRTLGSVTTADANRFILALDDPTSGVYTWLTTRW